MGIVTYHECDLCKAKEPGDATPDGWVYLGAEWPMFCAKCDSKLAEHYQHPRVEGTATTFSRENFDRESARPYCQTCGGEHLPNGCDPDRPAPIADKTLFERTAPWSSVPDYGATGGSETQPTDPPPQRVNDPATHPDYKAFYDKTPTPLTGTPTNWLDGAPRSELIPASEAWGKTLVGSDAKVANIGKTAQGRWRLSFDDGTNLTYPPDGKVLVHA